jgi:O-antigen ligase
MRRIAYFLSLVLVFSIPWEDALSIGSLGTLARAVGLLVAGAWLAAALVTGKIRKLHPFHLMAFLFILWNVSSIFWSAGINETMTHLKTYAQLGILAWIFWDLYTTPSSVRSALQAYILGAYVAIGSTIYNFLIGQEISAYSGGRYSGANVNAVDLALILILGLPLAWHLIISAENGARGNIQKLVNIAYIPFAIFAILLTASRTAVFSIVPVVFYIAITSPRLTPVFRLLISIALIGILFLVGAYLPEAPIDRLATTWNSIAAGDLGGRIPLWKATIAEFSGHPILGIGAGVLHNPAILNTVAHNTYLSILAELGLIGFFLFLILLVILVYEAYLQALSGNSLWITVLAAWAIGVFALSWEFKKPTWIFFSMVVASANLYNPKYMVSIVSKAYSMRNVEQGKIDGIAHETPST